MKKLLILFSLAVALVSCSNDDDVNEQQQPTNDYPCKFNVVYKKAGTPEIRYTEVGRYGKPERIIDFEITNYEAMIINAPSPENTSVYFEREILESDFRKYQSHFTSLGNLSATSEKIFVGVMKNDDWFQFDKNDTKTTGTIKVSFHCIHVN